MSMKALVRNLVNEGQDFEWYPTTETMIDVIEKDIRKRHGSNPSILDCGAGDGRMLVRLAGDHGKKYSIEKSAILASRQAREIIPVGTNFYESTLIDKKVDGVVCNPPYSDYENWAAKIIKEANAPDVYLVIPERWEKSETIALALESRNADTNILYTGDFLNADRQARAKIHIVHVNLAGRSGRIDDRYYSTRHRTPVVDPFEAWFKETFPEPKIYATEGQEQALKAKVKREMVMGNNLIRTLVQLYQHEMAELHRNYAAACSLDPDLLKELNVSYDGLRQAIKQRITGLKNLYWKELFHSYDSITSRLTTASRNNLLEKLNQNTAVDFTEDNAYAITLWVIKNANHYFDEQLVGLVERMIDRANIVLYKSNQRTFRDEEWRYTYGRGSRVPEELERFRLDYRIVLERMGGISTSDYSWERERNGGLTHTAADFLSDILSVARTLGWNCQDTVSHQGCSPRRWVSNQKQSFVCANGKPLMQVRAFKKGTVHVQFSPEFMLRLNVEFGRLKGWVKDHHQAAEEMHVTPAETFQHFNTNLQISPASSVLLLSQQNVDLDDLLTPKNTTAQQPQPRQHHAIYQDLCELAEEEGLELELV